MLRSIQSDLNRYREQDDRQEDLINKKINFYYKYLPLLMDATKKFLESRTKSYSSDEVNSGFHRIGGTKDLKQQSNFSLIVQNAGTINKLDILIQQQEAQPSYIMFPDRKVKELEERADEFKTIIKEHLKSDAVKDNPAELGIVGKFVNSILSILDMFLIHNEHYLNFRLSKLDCHNLDSTVEKTLYNQISQ